jgi:hypothetical protein
MPFHELLQLKTSWWSEEVQANHSCKWKTDGSVCLIFFCAPVCRLSSTCPLLLQVAALSTTLTELLGQLKLLLLTGVTTAHSYVTMYVIDYQVCKVQPLLLCLYTVACKSATDKSIGSMLHLACLQVPHVSLLRQELAPRCHNPWETYKPIACCFCTSFCRHKSCICH